MDVGTKSMMLLRSGIYCMGMGFGLSFESFSECTIGFEGCREVGAGRGCCVRISGLGCCLRISGVWVVSEAGQAGAGPQCVRFRPKSVELA